MKNKIEYISLRDAKKLIKKNNGKAFIAEICGNRINTLDDFFKEIYSAFKFPDNDYGFDQCFDYLTRLDQWIEEEEYVLIIYDYDIALSQDVESKKTIMSNFVDYILVWWEKEIKQYCIDGTPKKFNVFLVAPSDCF